MALGTACIYLAAVLVLRPLLTCARIPPPKNIRQPLIPPIRIAFPIPIAIAILAAPSPTPRREPGRP